jgi:hypothetical protein
VARPWLVVLASSLSGVSWVPGGNEVSVTDSVTVHPLWTVASACLLVPRDEEGW